MISNWSATWHQSHLYEDDVAPLIPTGAVLVIKQWYDNTEGNPNNPDPDQWVDGGSRTADEMSHAWIALTHLERMATRSLSQKERAPKSRGSLLRTNRSGRFRFWIFTDVLMGIEGRFAAAAAPTVPIVSLESAFDYPRSFEREFMMQIRMAVCGMAFALLLWGTLAGPAALAGPTALEAQVSGPGPDGRWPLQPRAPGNRTLAPFMEGWYANEDGTSASPSDTSMPTRTHYGFLWDRIISSSRLSSTVCSPRFFYPDTHGGSSPGLCGSDGGHRRLVDPPQSERRRHESPRPHRGRCLPIGLDAPASRQSASQRFLRLAVRRGPGTSGYHGRTYADPSR